MQVEIGGVNGIVAFENQLNKCREMLIRWSKEVFPNSDREITKLIKRVEVLKAGTYSEEIVQMVESLKKDIEEQWKREEVYWWQRARTTWLKAGDSNTSYFHRKTVMRRQQNLVVGLRNLQGEWEESEEGIANMVVDFYSSLFQSNGSWPTQVLEYEEERVSAQQNSRLTLLVTNEEIRVAAFSLGAFNASGPDGFNGHFYQSAWEDIKDSMTRMV